MSETTLITFTDRLNLTHPFWLLLGRRRRLISAPGAVVIERQHFHGVDDESGLEFISPMPTRETLSLYVDGNLFATTRPTGTTHPSAWISMPRNKRGKVTIRLRKRYTDINPLTET